MDGSEIEQWECLKKLHDFMPVTHLKLKTNKNSEQLLAFVQHNSGLVSLELGSVTNDYLEKLAPHLTKLDSFSIRAPKITAIPAAICDRVKYLSCEDCDSLTNINAPKATALTCYNCPALTNINAPEATELVCYNCRALTSINAPNVIYPDFAKCDRLGNDSRIKILNNGRRHIIINFWDKIDVLDTLLQTYYRRVIPKLGLSNVEFLSLEGLLRETQQLIIPAESSSAAEQLQCEAKLNSFQEEIFALPSKVSSLQSFQLAWFDDLRKLNNLQLQKDRLCWLAGLAAISAVTDRGPLVDPDALPTLTAIGNLTDPFLRRHATLALFAMYDFGASAQKEIWEKLNEQIPSHLFLPNLFLAQTKISAEKRVELLKALEGDYYKPTERLIPILETICLLSASKSLNALKHENILGIIFKKAPERGPRENAKKYQRTVEIYRSNQKKAVVACRDLLLFNKSQELTNVQNEAELLESHKKVCQEVFGVKAELAYKFNDTFKSKRYANALFTYAARLQTLPASQKTLLTHLLGEFVNGHLEGKFPGNRYDISNNMHLDTVFKNNEELFTKWKDPFEIDLSASENTSPPSLSSPDEILWGQMQVAIENGHLGENQKHLFPVLIQTIESNEPETVQEALKKVSGKLERVRNEIPSVSPQEKNELMQRESYLKIEAYCLMALCRDAELAARLVNLHKLHEELAALEFKNDVQGMIDMLDPSKASEAKWIKIETTDAWEDLLLMGSEVTNSCQRIDGDPDLNKCLLAYILDGKNKLMIVRDVEGKIAARSVLRILWDSQHKKPVLFMERIYHRTANSALSDLILRGCVEKAKEMGLPLVASPKEAPEKASYSESLCALGGPAPFEYVDALSGIQKNGEFTISRSNIIYTPLADEMN
jgi:hypothetical protein